MRRPVLHSLLALFLVAACQTGLRPDAGSAPVPAVSGEISTAPLDAPPSKGAKASAAAELPAGDPAKAALTVENAKPPAGKPKMSSEDVAKAAPKAPSSATEEALDAAAAAAAPPPPEPVKSEAQIACEKKRGRFAASGAGGAFACVQPTRDGGKRCRKESDCEGLCLARSMTCAPITPLFGCQEILQQDGKQVTQCVE